MLHNRCKILFAALFALVWLSGCSDGVVGSKERPFTMYFVPYIEAETIAKTAKHMRTYVQREVSRKLYGKDTGFYVKTAVPTSYITVVEALGTQKADFAALSTYAYILAHDIKKYDVEAIGTVVLHGNLSRYKGQIIARADSGIKSIADLQGKKLAYSDPASTSGYIMPSQMLKEQGIEPSEVVFAGKHDNVVTMVYQGQVDAGATFWAPVRNYVENGVKKIKVRDARNRVRKQFPDVLDKVKIVGYTNESPNGPWVMRTKLLKDNSENARLVRIVKEVLYAYTKSPEGAKHLKANYDIDGLIPAKLKEYEWISRAIRTQHDEMAKKSLE